MIKHKEHLFDFYLLLEGCVDVSFTCEGHGHDATVNKFTVGEVREMLRVLVDQLGKCTAARPLHISLRTSVGLAYIQVSYLGWV